MLLFLMFALKANSQVPGKKNHGQGTDEPMIDYAIPEPHPDEAKRAGYYVKDGKFGFVYPVGVKQDAVYDAIAYGIESFIVKKGSKFGIADQQGVLRTEIDFDSIGIMFNSVYIVKKKGKYGTFSESIKPVLSIKYKKILFCHKNHSVSFVNNGKEVKMIFNEKENVYSGNIENAEVYSNLVILNVKGKYGVFKQEQSIIPFEYDSIYAQEQENYSIYKGTKKVPEKFSFSYSNLSRSVNLLTVQKNGKLGLIDQQGIVVYPAEFDAVFNYNVYGYFTVKKDKLFGICFLRNYTTTPAEFDKVYADGIGYVMAVKNNKSGVFGLDGKQIVPFEYDNEFVAQLRVGFRVAKNRKRGILDKFGNVLVPTEYDDVETFYEEGLNNYFKVNVSGRYGILNQNAEIIIPIEYAWIGVDEGLFRVVQPSPDRKFGLYDFKGNLVVPVEYRYITKTETHESNILVLQLINKSYNFLDPQKQKIFSEPVVKYGYLHNEDNLLNPLSKAGNYLLYFVDGKRKSGMLNEVTGKIDIPAEYDEIVQKAEGRHTYLCARKGKKYGLINELNQVLIPFEYDHLSLDMCADHNIDEDDWVAVVAINKKFGTISFKNKITIPQVYDDLQRISTRGLFKAKKGGYFNLINLQNTTLNPQDFDEIANFEYSRGGEYEEEISEQALSFYKGKMRIINDKGDFISEPKIMKPHRGFKTFNELKFSLINALNSKDDKDLMTFSEKISPSPHLLYYLKNNVFNDATLGYVDLRFIREKYFEELMEFKKYRWQDTSDYGYLPAILTEVTDFTLYRNHLVTNARRKEEAFGDDHFMEKLLRNAIKVNGYWISSYFMSRRFDN